MAQRLAETPIDILINNAGIKGDDSKDMASLDVENMEWVLNVNTLGPVRVMKALFPNVQSSDGNLYFFGAKLRSYETQEHKGRLANVEYQRSQVQWII